MIKSINDWIMIISINHSIMVAVNAEPLGKCGNMFYMSYGGEEKVACELFDCDESMMFDEAAGQCRPEVKVQLRLI